MTDWLILHACFLLLTAVSAGMNVSACVSSDGGLWLWGSNVNYQLAKGSKEGEEQEVRGGGKDGG